MLSPTYPKRVPGKLRFTPTHGDTYTMFAEFGKNGVERLAALQPAGNSQRPDNKHYNDQVELFSRQALRPLSLKKEDVMKKAERVYNPM
jgi:acyl-homoserine-lactone acylase